MKSLDTRFAVGALFVFFMSVFGWAQALPMEPGTGTAEPGTGDVWSSSSMVNPVFPGNSSSSTVCVLYTIASEENLVAFAEIVNGTSSGTVYGSLVNDFVMDERSEWTPINVSKNATVVFNGNGHTISGLKFNDENRDSVGFFGRVEGVLTIRNLGIVNSGFKGRNYVGGLVGYNGGNNANLTIENSYNAGTVSGGYVGGLVGYNGGTLTITNSYNAGTVSETDLCVGGLVGYNGGENAKLTITNSYNSGAVSGTGGYVGGLVGYNSGTLTITNSFFLATGKDGDKLGGTPKSIDDFRNGDVAAELHNWCEKEEGSETCKEGGLNGSIWGQDLSNANSLPDFSGVFKYSLILHTFEGDTCEYPTEYVSEMGLELSTPTRENYVFVGWSTKRVAESAADMVNSIAAGETGDKEFYAQWRDANYCETPENLAMVDGIYQIGTCGDLYGFAEIVRIASNGEISGVLTDDIIVNALVLKTDGTLNGDGNNFTLWTPMNVQRDVKVTLNGAGHAVGGLYFNDENKDKVGLFGNVKGVVSIDSLGIVDSYFKGEQYVGALVGYGSTLTITNSYNAGIVSGNKYVGGLVGYNNGGTLSITNSYNAGTVSGSNVVGGLVGRNYAELTITNSYNAGTVSGTSGYVGGLVGTNGSFSTLTITNSYNAGTVSGTSGYVGGLVGYGSTLTITNSYNAGAVTGEYEVGGLVGYGNATLTITNSYNAGTVSGTDLYVGGLVGYGSNLTITNSFFLATGKNGDSYGGTETSLYDFYNGDVAAELHNWCEKEEGSETCKEGGLNGSVWGQDLSNANSLPDFSGVVGHKYGSVVFFDKKVDGTFDSAYVDATSELAVSFTENIVVSGPVKFKRTFAGSGYSTIMLPFQPNCSEGDCIKNGENVKFYEFGSYANATVRVTEVSPSALQANTPYLVQAAGVNELVFKNGGTFNTTEGGVFNSKTGEYKKVLDDGDGNVNGWTIYGTYAYKQWNAGDAGIGSTYGFAANDGVNDPAIVGEFRKVGAGAYIYPMRAYLEYTAPAPAGRPAANGVAANAVAGNANTVASLPETINVVIVEKGETGAVTGTEVAGSEDGAGTTRVIGTINTRTGEFKFATDRWFDLQGRYLGSKKPTQKGAYYNNGKKVIVK